MSIENFGDALPVARRDMAVRTNKSNLETKPRVTKQVEFTAWKRRRDGSVFVAKKGDSMQRPLIDGLASFNEAMDIILDQREHLIELWNQVNANDRVSDKDVRTQDESINTWNRWDYENLSPEKFLSEFPFRGVEFGDWVTQKERLPLLQKTYVSLCDLEDVIGKLDLSKLGLSLGNRGCGSHSAHYEPSNKVINLTKTKGAGALAHEYGHYLDFESGGELRRKVMEVLPRKALARFQRIDKSRGGKKYWSTPEEIFARCFEQYVKEYMNIRGLHNDFLANIVTIEEFPKNGDLYPYLLMDEGHYVYEVLKGYK